MKKKTPLQKAAQRCLGRIDQYGWGQGADRSPKMCAGEVIYVDVEVDALYEAFIEHTDGRSISRWNDDPERTEAQVRAVFEAIAA